MNIQSGIKGFKVKKTASGTYSTRESDLEKLADVHPIIADIFEYRELQKLLSTYIDAIPVLADEQGRIHPELLQMGAATGRFASQNPNIQNIPIKSDLGKKIRNAFVAPVGCSIVSADYSQIELRSAAMLSGDTTFIETFKNGGDVHASVASRVFNVPQSGVTADMRRRAKVINFGILFGMGVTALQKNLGTDRKDAQQFYDEYFKQMPGLAAYLEDSVMQAKKIGYTSTLFGRRRHFPGLRSSIPFIKAMTERAASNAPIQGTTADIIKLAMIKIEEEIGKRGFSANVFMVMQIHDELVFEVADNVLDEAKKMIKEVMESVLETVPVEIANKVPITVSIASGKNWNEAK
jgi:DNA polymerase-1